MTVLWVALAIVSGLVFVVNVGNLINGCNRLISFVGMGYGTAGMLVFLLLAKG